MELPDADCIFGSPAEPLYNVPVHSMKDELLEEWLQTLIEENKAEYHGQKHVWLASKNGKTAEFVLLTATHFNLTPHAKYLALEIFDRFMEAHLKELYKYVLNSDSANKKKDLDAILDRVKTQLVLRVITCCQIASKLTSHYRVISNKQAWRALDLFAHKYSFDSILSSEMRVLKALKYKVQLKTPLLFIETLLEYIGRKDSSLPIKSLHAVCLRLIDLLYLRRAWIYEALYKVVTGNLSPTPEQRAGFSPVEKDFMLTAVGIIAAAMYILNNDQCDKVICLLSKATCIPTADIVDFAAVLAQAAGLE